MLPRSFLSSFSSSHALIYSEYLNLKPIWHWIFDFIELEHVHALHHIVVHITLFANKCACDIVLCVRDACPPSRLPPSNTHTHTHAFVQLFVRHHLLYFDFLCFLFRSQLRYTALVLHCILFNFLIRMAVGWFQNTCTRFSIFHIRTRIHFVAFFGTGCFLNTANYNQLEYEVKIQPMLWHLNRKLQRTRNKLQWSTTRSQTTGAAACILSLCAFRSCLCASSYGIPTMYFHSP